MARPALERYLTGVTPLAVLSALLIAALMMMNAATQNSARFAHLYSLLLLANVLGVAVLLGLILYNLRRLFRQYRERVMGSRLTLRLLGMFTLLAVIPVSVVYLFSLQALNRGIDNWFDLRIEQALNDALSLGRTALDALRDDLTTKSRDMATELEDVPDRATITLLNDLREHYGVQELTLYTQSGRIVASSSGGLDSARLVPQRPAESLLSEVRQGATRSSFDLTGDSGLQLRVVVPVYSREMAAPPRILQVTQPLPTHYRKLGESVQAAFSEYEKLVYLRGPLKFGFTLTLSLVALLTLLIAVWASIFTARRLVNPIRDLAEGTRAVALGNYRKQLPVPGNDELGVLVRSFNDMTRRIHRAQNQVRRGQREAEMQRTYLETILTHLSSGVLSFNGRRQLRMHNASAAQILGVDLGRAEGRTLDAIGTSWPQLTPIVQAVGEAMEQGRSEWQTEVSLIGQGGRRILILRGTMLPGFRSRHGGHVVVFDDATALIQAQRDAAWGEVARRLAHEIKNPLTPIQLSAERIRRKCMAQLPDAERDTLDRATHTIVQQVETMKTMVNAFSDYARPAAMKTEPVDLNRLVQDVTELYRGRRGAWRMQLDLEPDMPRILADPGRLRQVLHNLLLNAGDALAGVTDPELRIGTRCNQESGCRYVDLQVQDNGPGFSPSVIDHLFEPYVTTKDKGTGLGLAIVKKIVEEHNGTLWAENLKGGGASITLRLPTREATSGGGELPAERSA